MSRADLLQPQRRDFIEFLEFGIAPVADAPVADGGGIAIDRRIIETRNIRAAGREGHQSNRRHQ